MICPVVTAESCIVKALEEMASKYQINFVFFYVKKPLTGKKKSDLELCHLICWIRVGCFFKFICQLKLN